MIKKVMKNGNQRLVMLIAGIYKVKKRFKKKS